MAKPDVDLREIFVQLSVEITGFDRSIITGTGLVDQNLRALRSIAGKPVMDKVLSDWDANDPYSFEPDAIPIVNNIVRTWYLGKWVALSAAELRALSLPKGGPAGLNHVLSPEAYREALAWKVVHAHPPGAKQPGFGSWTEVPK